MKTKRLKKKHLNNLLTNEMAVVKDMFGSGLGRYHLYKSGEVVKVLYKDFMIENAVECVSMTTGLRQTLSINDLKVIRGGRK